MITHDNPVAATYAFAYLARKSYEMTE